MFYKLKLLLQLLCLDPDQPNAVVIGRGERGRCNCQVVVDLVVILGRWAVCETLPEVFLLVEIEPLEVLEHAQIHQVLPLLLRDIDPLLTIESLIEHVLITQQVFKIPKLKDLELVQLLLYLHAHPTLLFVVDLP